MKKDVEVISAFFDEKRTPDACQDLESWLNERSENVSAFVDHLLLHNDLEQLALAEDLVRYDRERRVAGPSGGASGVTQAAPHMQKKTRRPFRLPMVFASMALAAGLLLVASVSLLTSGSGPDVAERDATAPAVAPATESDEEATPIASEVQFAATVSDLDNCTWTEDSLALHFGQALEPGSQISLSQGLAQLTFETGAVVILEGPCRLSLEDNAISLSLGRISATVPRSAFGFSVVTPNSQIVDLGTEFGVDVTAAGRTQVHVFKGEVISRKIDDTGIPDGEFVRLSTNHAIEFRPGTKAARQFEANEAAFVRRLRSVAPHEQSEVAPVEGALLLWLAGNQGVLQDESGGVLAWLDTLTPTSNWTADNALQPAVEFRPKLVDDAIAGLPTLRFDGENDCLTTTPMPNGDSQTIAFVAAFGEGYTRKGRGNLLNYNGPPQRIGPDTSSGRLSILQIRACPVGPSTLPLVDPYVYAGHWRGEDLFVGRMEHQSRSSTLEAGGPDFGEPFIGVYVYDTGRNRAELFVNGKSFGRSTAPVSAAITSRKVIARHGHWHDYFCGDIAELLIFDEGLDEERVGQLTTYLSSKYQVKLSQE